MRIRTAAVALTVAIAFAGSALACGADKSAKVQTKEKTASTQTLKADTAKKKGG
jgi:hypothetical protein